MISMADYLWPCRFRANSLFNQLASLFSSCFKQKIPLFALAGNFSRKLLHLGRLETPITRSRRQF
jgi:hypothetical protein